MGDNEASTTDGRRARRARNRAAVVDATFELIESGIVRPTSEAIAERSGVSVSSVFRYFDGVEDLQRASIDRYFQRYSQLFEVPSLGVGHLGVRVKGLVRARVHLYATIAPIARHARAIASQNSEIAQSLHATRLSFIGQVNNQFQPELSAMAQDRADETVVAIDVLTSFESWDLQHVAHQLSNDSITQAMINGVTALLASPATTHPVI